MFQEGDSTRTLCRKTRTVTLFQSGLEGLWAQFTPYGAIPLAPERPRAVQTVAPGLVHVDHRSSLAVAVMGFAFYDPVPS